MLSPAACVGEPQIMHRRRSVSAVLYTARCPWRKYYAGTSTLSGSRT